jgi:hypothetical protein
MQLNDNVLSATKEPAVLEYLLFGAFDVKLKPIDV